MGRIGIVVIAFNIEEYIRQCLESIIHQSYKELQIVVVDDGSEDSTGIICDEVAAGDGRITVIHQKNQGPIVARYQGLKALDTEYVTFVDGDDWLAENTFQEIMDTKLIGAVEMIAFGVVCIHNDKDWFYTVENFPEGQYTREQIEKELLPTVFWDCDKERNGIYPSLWAKIYKRELLESYFLDIKDLHFHYAEDSAIVYPLIINLNSLAILHSCFYYYRLRKSTQVPGYVRDDEFFDKLSLFYGHMRKAFSKSKYKEIMVKQLDYFYIFSTKFRKWIYGDKIDNDKFLFPFDRVDKGSTVVLYGGGTVGQTFYKQLERLDYCKLIGWVDQNYSDYNRKEITGVNSLKALEFDYIVIAVSSKEIVDAIEKNLITMGIEKGKLIRII